MAYAAAYRHEELQKVPRGYRVRSVKRGSHVVRIAFPPGPRKKGSGKVVEILHPNGENNPSCIVSNQAKNNPGELLIFGNPGTQLNPELFDAIRPGSRVTFVDKQAALRGEHKLRTGRAVMRGPFGWVLNMGGRHGTPQVVHADMVVRVKNGNPSAQDIAWQHQKKVQAILKKMPKPIRKVFDRNPKRATQRRRRTDRNPDETKQAVKLFQSFHGRDPKDITEKHVSAEIRKDYAALGDLEYLKVTTPIGQTATFNFEGDGVKLASSPDGKQLYCIGGNQNLAQCLDADSLGKDFIDLGECTEVQYLARKVHGNFEPVSYFHKFGEKTGARPQLAYDKLKKQIFFVGGEYFIKHDCGVSPGIEN